MNRLLRYRSSSPPPGTPSRAMRSNQDKKIYIGFPTYMFCGCSGTNYKPFVGSRSGSTYRLFFGSRREKTDLRRSYSFRITEYNNVFELNQKRSRIRSITSFILIINSPIRLIRGIGRGRP